MSLKYALVTATLAALLSTGCGVSQIAAPAVPELPPPKIEVEQSPQPAISAATAVPPEPSTLGQSPADVAEPSAEAVQAGPATLWPDGQAQTDEQGQVIVAISPLNLNNPGETLDFDVGMNTHSVTLNMDLAALSTLTTDTGQIVAGLLWDAPRGGHHVFGVLSFPALVDGAPLLESATSLTLTIVEVDAPERVFVWETSS